MQEVLSEHQKILSYCVGDQSTRTGCTEAGVFLLGDVQKLSGCVPEQPAVDSHASIGALGKVTSKIPFQPLILYSLKN